jgi:hypothetical protein
MRYPSEIKWWIGISGSEKRSRFTHVVDVKRNRSDQTISRSGNQEHVFDTVCQFGVGTIPLDGRRRLRIRQNNVKQYLSQKFKTDQYDYMNQVTLGVVGNYLSGSDPIFWC